MWEPNDRAGVLRAAGQDCRKPFDERVKFQIVVRMAKTLKAKFSGTPNIGIVDWPNENSRWMAG